MNSRIPRVLAVAGAIALFTTACNVDPERAGQAAERVMTVAAQITPSAVETVMASSPLGTPAAAAPAQAPLVYARCITRGEAALKQLPNEDATEMAALAGRSIITAYGRTADATWVLGWDAGRVSGWLPAAVVGCTAPIEDLRPTDAGLLLTPTAAATIEMTAEATAEGTLEATAEGTLEATATEAASGTPLAAETALPAEMPTAKATSIPTQMPATATPEPAATTLPTVTPAPTRASSTATTAPAGTSAPAPVITVVVTATPPRSSVPVPQPEERGSGEAQVRDLRCIVTPGTPVNLRNGPARTNRLLATLPAGTRFLAQGRNDDATWIYGFTERQEPGWLIMSSVECDGNPAQLVEVDR